jgi:tetratricopeptide (TPR) repeat protein
MLYVLLRRSALGEVVGTASPALPVGQRSLLDLAAAVGVYVETSGRRPQRLHRSHRCRPAARRLALLLLAGLATAAWRWSTTRADGVPLFALAWLALTLLPSLAIVWKIPDAPIAERYLYLPSVGFCMLVGVLTARAWDGLASRVLRVGLAAVIGAVLLAATLGTVRRNPVWHDDIALWEDTEPKSQLSGLAARNLGTAYQQAGRAADARAAFEQALRRRNDPRGVQTIYNNLGTLAMYDGDYATAQRDYRQALAASPEAADTLFNLGLAVLQGGGQSPAAARAALPYYEHALRLSPHDSDIEAGSRGVHLPASGGHGRPRQPRPGARGAGTDRRESARDILRRAGASPPPDPDPKLPIKAPTISSAPKWGAAVSPAPLPKEGPPSGRFSPERSGAAGGGTNRAS